MSDQQNPNQPRSMDAELLAGIQSSLGKGLSFQGNVVSDSDSPGLRIFGTFQGHINLPGGVLHIAEGAKIEPIDGKPSTIVADHILIEGEVDADIRAAQLIELLGTARVRGVIAYGGDIDLHKGARVSASLNSTTEPTSAAQNIHLIARPVQRGPVGAAPRAEDASQPGAATVATA